jgi:hypothetical protein
MLRSERSPAWQRDVKWLSAIVLVLGLAVATLTFSLSELTVRSRALPVLHEMLRLTLMPEGSGGAGLAVRTGAAYQPGQKLTLLPGVDVYADPTEVPTFTVDEAINRIAGVLTDKTIQGGSAGALALVTDTGMRAQLQQALQGTVLELVRAGLGNEMLPSGLENGSRLADWPKQAADHPGQPVQPIVGIFEYVAPAQIRTMTDRQIGELVVSKLADGVLADGMEATRQKVVNSNLRARFDQALQQGVPASLHGFYAMLFLGHRDAIASRLAEAKAAIQGNQQKSESLAGLLPASQLAGLSQQQANAAVLDALAKRSYEQGPGAIVSLMTRNDQKTKVQHVARLLTAFSAGAHRRYLAWTWLTGAVALLFLIVLLATTPGLQRLVYAGIAVALGAAGGSYAFSRMTSLHEAAAAPQAALAQFGMLGGFLTTARYVAKALPPDVWTLPMRNYLIVLGFGGALVLLAVVLWLLQRLRPRRRSLL